MLTNPVILMAALVVAALFVAAFWPLADGKHDGGDE